MQKLKVTIFISILLILSFSCSNNRSQADAITTGSLFEEMIDLVRLADFPDKNFRTVQFSSFDRRSDLPAGPDWFANADGFGQEPIPNFEKVLSEPDENGIGEYLITEQKGPGVIVRLWSAAISGEIKLVLDGKEEPFYEGEAIDFFHKTFAHFPQTQELDTDSFAKAFYQRDAVYAPIPFADSMRLIWTGDLQTIHFYQVQVRLYDSGTEISSFSPEDLILYQDTINRVTAALADPDKNLSLHSQLSNVDIAADLDAGMQQEVLTLTGPGALERLEFKVRAEHMDQALRQTMLYIICDDHPWGQVQSPLGDFFGAAPGINPYQSLPFTIEPDGTMICRFVMPFEKNLKIVLHNLGEQTINVTGSALPMKFAWQADRSMHFRARWRVDHDLIASNQEVQDLPFLLAHGKGLYVGTTSILLNPNNVPTPYGNWWGEGDEKIFIDDDILPSTFGTGSEDYYNYSWSSPDIFYFAYCGQPRNDGPGNRGFVTNYRWHILDTLPFENHIRFYMELFSHERTPGLSYARTAYHYALPGMTDDHTAVKPADLRHLVLPADWIPAARMGARNSKIYPAEKLLSKGQNTRFNSSRLWAEGKILTWIPNTKGESLDFSFNVIETGQYRVHFVAGLSPQAGRISLKLDGNPSPLNNQKTIVDLFRPYRTLLRNFTLPNTELTAGKHKLTLHYEGAEQSIEYPQVGIDFIWIQEIKQ